MVQTSKMFSQAHTVNNNTVFHAMCLSNWAYYAPDLNRDSQIAAAIAMPLPEFVTLAGTNAPQFFISSSAKGSQVAIAGTTTLRQWMDYIMQAGVVNATGLIGKTFGPFDHWSNLIVDVLLTKLSINDPLILSGHSLGGAMAILVAEKLRNFGFQRTVVYTFGCPRVGDREFTSNYESLVHNLRNQSDIVPSLPPPALSYVRFFPSFEQVLPYTSRPGHDYMIPHGPRPWLNPSTLVLAGAFTQWPANIPARALVEHGEFSYLRSAWRLGNQRERFKASDWYAVCNGIWGVGLSPEP